MRCSECHETITVAQCDAHYATKHPKSTLGKRFDDGAVVWPPRLSLDDTDLESLNSGMRESLEAQGYTVGPACWMFLDWATGWHSGHAPSAPCRYPCPAHACIPVPAKAAHRRRFST